MLKEMSPVPESVVVLFPLQKMEMSKFWTVVENPIWGTNLLDNGNLTLTL
jgi:hypothetical protein